MSATQEQDIKQIILVVWFSYPPVSINLSFNWLDCLPVVLGDLVSDHKQNQQVKMGRILVGRFPHTPSVPTPHLTDLPYQTSQALDPINITLMRAAAYWLISNQTQLHAP